MQQGTAVTLRHQTTRGRRRLFTDLPAALTRRYEAAVVAAAPRVEARLGEGVLAGRLVGGVARPPAMERAAWRARLATIRPGSVVVLGDVRDCFASIRSDAVALALAEAGVPPGPVLSVLAACAAAGTRGLPIGPWPSAALANLVLSHGDRAVRATGAAMFRWVDDVVIVGHDRAAATTALDAWASALARAGLQVHEGKTRILGADGWDAQLALGASMVGASDVACYARREDPLPRRARPHPGPASTG